MDNYIKEIWQVFKHEKKERFYLFYEEDNRLLCEKISKNETESSGEVDLNRLIHIAHLLDGKSVIAVHNHPNDKPTPSYPDFVQKEYLESLLRLINVTMKDYVIVSDYGYISFVDSSMHKAIPHTQIEKSGTIEEVLLPSLLLASSVMQHQDKIKGLLEHYSEVVYTPSKQYASNKFSGEFLLDSRGIFSSKAVFFCREVKSDSVMRRLQDINQAVEPIEIYISDGNDLFPLKKNGAL